MMSIRGAAPLLAICAALLATPAVAAEQALIDAAKKEGRVVWYTTQQIDPLVRPVVAAFKQKYGVDVDYVRADSSDVALRIVNEGRAGKMQSDVFDGTGVAAILKTEKMAVKWLPDTVKRLPKDYVDPEGYWVATNIFVVTAGYNTNLVPRGSEPKSFADLLDPKWKGKILWNSSPSTSGGGGFIGLTLARLGEDKGMDYLRKLATQNITGVLNASRAGLDPVVAGEFPLALNIFNNHTIISKAQGAPITWVPMAPVMAVLSVASVTKGAPHPNAGKLLVDFLVSKEGQQLFREADYIPVDPAIPPRDASLRPDSGGFSAIYFTPEQVAGSMPGWMKILRDLFG